ncbi:hypothetical protein SO802_011743 [Lithocarpus litseifolius]|uniref:Sesquiterpene synthase n=1 Tax=Lithocarpus litseifolius TaxID=425828 RepID=A0AAW2D1H9_9ROSI
MYAQVSALAFPTKNDMPQTVRRSANYQPSIWGDRFLTYGAEFLETEDNLKQQVQELKEEVRSMLTSPVEKPSQKLNLIDALQRLGVSYHFENEIEETLQQLHMTLHDSDDQENDDDLYIVALQFRLLRQQGYNISSEKFTKFKDSKGNFKESLIDDTRAILSLYEATHLRVHGEDILDEALVFTTTHLEFVASNLSTPLAAQVSHALKQPIRKGLPRLEARHYFSIYQEDPSHDKVLLTFAKLDFNLLQKMHQKELSDIARWWKELNFSKKLPFIRDRVIECYFWILGVYFEPKYFLARRILTKVIAMTSIVDDIYDVYGTLEEIELFTEAIERWDISATDQLPEYMKVCYKALLDVYCEMEEKIGEGRSYRIRHAIEAFEQARGHVASAVECYMAQFGAAEEEAINEFRKQVIDAWKVINKECLYPTIVPMPVLMRIVNLSRVMDVVYKDQDGYTNAGIVLKDFIRSMLIDPVPL